MKPSEEITKLGNEAELNWLRENSNQDYTPKTSVVVKMQAELNYMKKFIDEIYKAVNKEK